MNSEPQSAAPSEQPNENESSTKQNESSAFIRWLNDPYTIKSKARSVKIIFQMMIGLGLAILIVLRLWWRIKGANCAPLSTGFRLFCRLGILDLVGQALLYATGIELAYTLFTPGPDEAVEPLIMGVAATVLLGIAKTNFDTINIWFAVTIAIYVAILAVLFKVKERFIEDKKD